MKPKEISSNILQTDDAMDEELNNHLPDEDPDNEFGDDHVISSYETPLRPDAFDTTDDEKIKKIEHHFREIMTILGLDLTDDSLSGTPRRVAKMYVKEVFSGL